MAKWLYRLTLPQAEINPLVERFNEIKYKPIIGESYNDLIARESGNVEITLTINTPRGRTHRYIAEEMFTTYNAKMIREPVRLVITKSEKLWQYLADMWKEGTAIYLGTMAAVAGTFDIIIKHIELTVVEGETKWILSLGYFDYILLFLLGAIPSLVYLLTAHKGISKDDFQKKTPV